MSARTEGAWARYKLHLRLDAVLESFAGLMRDNGAPDVVEAIQSVRRRNVTAMSAIQNDAYADRARGHYGSAVTSGQANISAAGGALVVPHLAPARERNQRATKH